MKKASIVFFKLCLIGLFVISFTQKGKAEGEKAPLVELQSVWKEKKVSLVLQKAARLTTVEIKDGSDRVLISNEVPKNGAIRKLYNFEELASGQYTIEINSGEKVIIQPIVINANRMSLDTTLQKEYFHPKIQGKLTKDFIDVRILNRSSEKIAIELFNDNDDLVITESFKTTVNRRYNLKRSRSRFYMVKVTTPYKTYFQHIE